MKLLDWEGSFHLELGIIVAAAKVRLDVAAPKVQVTFSGVSLELMPYMWGVILAPV